MIENPLEQKEKPAVKVKKANLEDWQKCKELELEIIYGEDAYMFGVTEENRWGRAIKEEAKYEKEWKEILDTKTAFGVLSWNGSDVVGIGLAEKRQEKGDWLMYSGYVKKDFRRMKIGEKIFATRLNEIRTNRGGGKVVIAVKAINDPSINLAQSFGFKKQVEESTEEGFYMTLDDVNSPEVIKKINEVLDAG